MGEKTFKLGSFFEIINILLNKMGISNNKNCAFGCTQTDNREKKFFTCEKI